MTYGDHDNVTKDAKTIREIMARQGCDILLECMADHVGECKNKFDLSQADVNRVITANISLYTEMVNERT